MQYKLKPGQENFEIMSGTDEGKKFLRGRNYEVVPAGYEARFERAGAENFPPNQAQEKKQAPEDKPSWVPESPDDGPKSKIQSPKSKTEKGE